MTSYWISMEWAVFRGSGRKSMQFECVHDVSILVYITLKLAASACQSFPFSLVLSILWLSCQHFGKCYLPLSSFTYTQSVGLAHPNFEIELRAFLLSILPFWFRYGVCALDCNPCHTHTFASTFLLCLFFWFPIRKFHCVSTYLQIIIISSAIT